ncbi:MAG TPA: type I methionyl aminopeptidase [Oligoflexia bacterium]|nr:type I methionyl aminopeptidase [Oligoflexia bacterium]HMR25752.1 type I methionyl aminopeptidase [Oligoflexia bacterium]
MVNIKSKEELEIMRKVNRLLAGVRETLKEMVKPGVTTLELDKKAEAMIREKGAVPAFKGYHGFPSTLCTSINEEVVHGIPSNRVLEEGDVLGMDMGAILNGFYADTAVTCMVGKVSLEAQKLLKTTEESLYRGIDQARPGGRLNDIGAAVQKCVEKEGYSVVREFVGHGIGKQLHEDPQVPNYGIAGTGMMLKVGMVLAIEPMVNIGGPKVNILDDGWTAVTEDGSLSAHFEHTVAITENGPEILTQV